MQSQIKLQFYFIRPVLMSSDQIPHSLTSFQLTELTNKPLHSDHLTIYPNNPIDWIHNNRRRSQR